MAISRERRTALAELMVATTRMNTAKLMLRSEDQEDSDDRVAQLLAAVGECIDRAMAALKS